MNILPKLILFTILISNINVIYPKSFQLQNQTTIGIVDSIICVGNTKTKAFVILREIKISKGDTLTNFILEETKNRLYSLQLFNSVEIFTVPKDSQHCDVIIQVNERWFIYPIPIIGIKDHSWKKFYFGLGLVNVNFRGMNEKIFLFGSLGYEPGFQAQYKTPNIKLIKNGFLEISTSFLKIENRSQNILQSNTKFYYKTYNASLTLGKRLNLYQDLWISLGFQLLNVEKNLSFATLNKSGKDNFPTLGLGYKYDTRDLNDFTMSGTYFYYHLKKFGLFQKNINYIKNYFDFRKFVILKKDVSFAFRNYLVLSHGKQIPSYNLAHIGYNEKIRGHFTKTYEGENVLIASGEVRVFILRPKYFNLDQIPIPEFNVWKFGVAATLFGDAGKVWYNNEPFKWERLIKGFGVGLNFILPYHLVVRLEYAKNEFNKNEFIIDLYSSF